MNNKKTICLITGSIISVLLGYICYNYNMININSSLITKVVIIFNFSLFLLILLLKKNTNNINH